MSLLLIVTTLSLCLSEWVSRPIFQGYDKESDKKAEIFDARSISVTENNENILLAETSKIHKILISNPFHYFVWIGSDTSGTLDGLRDKATLERPRKLFQLDETVYFNDNGRLRQFDKSGLVTTIFSYSNFHLDYVLPWTIDRYIGVNASSMVILDRNGTIEMTLGSDFTLISSFTVTQDNKLYVVGDKGVMELDLLTMKISLVSSMSFSNNTDIACKQNLIYVTDVTNCTVSIVNVTIDSLIHQVYIKDLLEISLDQSDILGFFALTKENILKYQNLEPNVLVTFAKMESGFLDSPISRFKLISGISAASDGSILITDLGNRAIRKIDTNRTMSTSSTFYNNFPNFKSFYIQDSEFQVNGSTVIHNGSIAFNCNETLVGVHGTGTNIFAFSEYAIYNMSSGEVIAGRPNVSGCNDGLFATFGQISGISLQYSEIIISDKRCHALRRLELASKSVSRFSGSYLTQLRIDGNSNESRFDSPGEIVFTNNSFILIDGEYLRSVDINGKVSTLPYQVGNPRDGYGSRASLGKPVTISGTFTEIYVADHYSVRLVTWDNRVTTIAGFGAPWSSDIFHGSCGISKSDGGMLYVSDPVGNQILAFDMSQNYKSHVLAGNGGIGWNDGIAREAQFNNPIGITVVQGNMLFVADSLNHLIRIVLLSNSSVVTFAGTGKPGYKDSIQSLEASFNMPHSIVHDAKNNQLYVSDYGNHVIRKIDLRLGSVISVSGSAGQPGSTDGLGMFGQYRNPSFMQQHGRKIFISDEGNNLLRSFDIETGQVETLVGSGSGSGSYSHLLSKPQGITVLNETIILVADYFSGRILEFDLVQRKVTNLFQSPAPKGIYYDGSDNTVYVTNANSLRKFEVQGSSNRHSTPASTMAVSQGEGLQAGYIILILVSSLGLFYIIYRYRDTCLYLLQRRERSKSFMDPLSSAKAIQSRHPKVKLKRGVSVLNAIEIDLKQALTFPHSGKRLMKSSDGTYTKAELLDSALIDSSGVKEVMAKFYSHAENKSFRYELAVFDILGDAHMNVLRLIGFSDIPQRALIFQFIPDTLADLLSERRADKPDFDVILLDVAKGMRYIHDRQIIHYDLRPGNIFVMDGKRQRAKIGNFGYPDFLSQAQSNSTGASSGRSGFRARYTAPEVYKDITFHGQSLVVSIDGKVDVFSFAMIMYCICMDGERPWSDLSDKSIREKVQFGERPNLRKVFQFSHLKDLIKDCWEQESVRRPDFQDIVSILKNLQ